MKTNPTLRSWLRPSLTRLTVAAAAWGAPHALAADKFFDFATSGAVWDNGTTSNFGLVTGGPYTSPWAAYDVARFEGTGGAVTLSGAPNVNKLIFNADGYVINGSTLNMGDPGGSDNFTVNSTHTATINSNISQPFNTAIQKAGTGTLVLGGTVTATVNNNRIDGGTLRLAGGAFSGSAWIADSTGSSGTLDVTGGNHSISTMTVATRGNGTFTISAGTVTVPSVSVGHSVADVSSGTVNLNGGNLVVGSGGITAPGASDTTVFNFNGGTLRASASSATFMANALDRANVRNGGALIDTQGFNVTIAQPLLHSNIGGDAATDGGLTKAGTGTLTLTGANTYTGPTTIPASSGTVIGTVNSAQNSFGAGSASVGAGSTLRFENTETAGSALTTISNTLTGSGTVQINFAAGASARNTNMSNVNAFAGTIQLTASGATGDKWGLNGSRNAPSATVDIGSGAQMFVHGGNSTFGQVRLAGTGNSEDRGAIRLTSSLTAPLVLTGSATIGGEGGVITGTVSTGVAGTSTLTLGTVNSNNLPANMMNGVMSDGTGTLALRIYNVNSGNVIINGGAANTYSGGTTLLNNGSGTRLTIGAITGTPYGSGPITIGQVATDKAGIFFTTANQTLANPLVFNTRLGTDRFGVRVDTTNITLSGQITANLADASFSTNGTGSFNLTGKVTGTSGLRLENTHGTTITVNLNNAAQNNDYAGNTFIEGTKGVLNLGAANQIPNGAGKGNLANSGLVNLNGFSETVNGLSGSGVIDGVSGTPTLTIGDANATGTTYSGTFRNTAGSLTVVKTGGGDQTFSSATASTHTGGTVVNGGRLVISNANAIGASAVTVASGAEILATSGATFNNAFTISGDGGTGSTQDTQLRGAIRLDNGTISSSGSVLMLADSSFGSYNNNTGTVNAPISGGFALSINKSSLNGPGTIVLGGANTYSGDTTVNNGFLRLGATEAIPHGAGKGNLVVNGEFRLAGFSETVNGLSGSGVVEGLSGTPTLTVGENNATSAFTGTIKNSAGALNLTKVGSGTLTLTSAANTYAGTTSVTGGGLVAAGGNAIGDVSVVDLANTAGVQLQLNASEAVGALAGGGATGGGVNMQGNNLTVGAANASTSYGGSLSGTGGTLVKTGSGTQTLTGTNTRTGKTSVQQGTLHLANGALSLGSPSAGADALTLGSAGNSGTLQVSGGNLTLAAGRGLTLAGNGGTLDVGAGRTLSLNDAISGNVAGSTFTKAGTGTFNLTGNADINVLVVAEGEYNQLAGVTQILSSGTGLTIQNGATYRLSGGTLKTDKITTTGTGKFNWGAGTLIARSSNGNLGTTDYTAAGYHAIQTGLTSTIAGNVATATGSVWALHGSPTLYLNNGVRFNNWAITGDLDLTAAGDTLEFEMNPYFLRPFSSAGIGATETGSLPLITWTGAFAPGGAFTTVTGIIPTGAGFTESGFAVTDPTALATDTWYIEYDTAAQTVWFHFKVSGYVPEPGSFGLLAGGALGLRLMRSLRNHRRRIGTAPN